MSLQVVAPVDYATHGGIEQIYILTRALNDALAKEDWAAIRRLDKSCAVLVDKIIAVERDDISILLYALNELKSAYYHVIQQCNHKVCFNGAPI